MQRIGVRTMAATNGLKFLEDKWDEAVAAKLDGPELLRYRSNLLGSDLRITNFGGGNTSSKLDQVDPLDGQTKKILWVKGSGGDAGRIKEAGVRAGDDAEEDCCRDAGVRWRGAGWAWAVYVGKHAA